MSKNYMLDVVAAKDMSGGHGLEQTGWIGALPPTDYRQILLVVLALAVIIPSVGIAIRVFARRQYADILARSRDDAERLDRVSR